MKSPDGITTPVWFEQIKVPKFRSVSAKQAIDVDVCVVGAGIAGLTTAYMAACQGRSVVVLDEGEIGSGQTGRTSAHLASAMDDRFINIEKMHGVQGSKLAHESHAAAIDKIEEIARVEKIDCEFARLNAYLSGSSNLLKKELAAAKRAGFDDVEMLPDGGFDGGPRLRFGNQARFQPMLYLIGLAEAFKRKGGKIYTGRRVIDVQGVDEKKKSPAKIKIQGLRKSVTAGHVVVATNTPSPINDWFGIYTKQSSYRSYMIGVAIPRKSIEDALYWDTADPYHYVRLEQSPEDGDDILLVGGEDHKTGQFPEKGAPFIKLEEWAKKHFPQLDEVRYRWSGQVQEPADGLAFIGRALTEKSEVYVATGDSGMGLTHGTIAGILINDQIAGRPNPWEKLYDPGRKIMNLDYVKENANTVAQYKDLLTPGEVKSVDEISPGHGALIRDGLTKVAVYRDDSGSIHKCSAICTHMQCVVNWNHVERSWDCPCHGSRFDATGKVLMGPAIDDLPKVK